MKRFQQQLCLGEMKVYQNILLLFSCQFIHTLALECEMIMGLLNQIDAGSGSVVGVTYRDEVYILKDRVFMRINASLKHVSVGPAGLFGVDAANKVFKLQAGRFVQFPGLLKQVDAGGDQFVAGVNMYDGIFCLNMDDNNKRTASTIPWVQMNGKLKYYSCGPYSCWGVSSSEEIYIVKDVSRNVCTGSGTFEKVEGRLSMIEVATDGSVFGISRDHLLFQRSGVTRSNPIGTAWKMMDVCPKVHNGHKHVSVDLGIMWVLCNDGVINRCTL